MKALSSAALVCAALAFSGCGGGAQSKASATSSMTDTTSTANSSGQVLERAVRAALQQNSRLSFYTLWHNAIPAWAQQSTRGPALAELRASAAQRRKQGVQIRHLSGRLEILSVNLDPSYARAAAIVRATDRLRPYRSGRPSGQSIAQKERARIELHRLGHTPRFVVWRVVLLR